MSRTTPAAGSTRESPEVEKPPRDWSGFKSKLKSKPARILYTIGIIVGGSLGIVIVAEWYFAAWVYIDQVMGAILTKPLWEPAFTFSFGIAYVFGGLIGNFFIIAGLVAVGLVLHKVYELGKDLYVEISKGMGGKP